MPIRISGALALAALACTGVAVAKEKPVPAERVVSGDRMLTVTIGGIPGRLRIDPSAASMPVLNPDYAKRAGLKPGMFGVGRRIGPVTVDGATGVKPIELDQIPGKRRMAWFQRDIATTADGVIGPGGLPESVVRFTLRAPRPGEQIVTLPMEGSGGLLGGWETLRGMIQVGGTPIKVFFDLQQRSAQATAGAAVLLARAQGGTMEGDPASIDMGFGVERPVRTMRLAKPLMIGTLSIDTIRVRIADFGSAAAIRESGEDPDEVVVSAGQKQDHKRDQMRLGLDQLDHCSSIVFDTPAQQIRLSCL